MSKISIILPIYNVEKYLKRCVDSILNQTIEDIEIILATDGPESCDKICEEYATKDNRVKIVSHPGSYGKAFNKSLEIASGEYIGIVETDDWCDLTMFEKLYNKAKENDADVVKCGFYFAYDDENKNTFEVWDEYNENLDIFENQKFLASQPSVWSCIYKKDFLTKNNIKMIEDRMAFIDAPFHYETLYKADKYVLLKEPLYYYYQDNENQTVRNVKPLDGLRAEKYAFAKIKESNNFEKLQKGFINSTSLHLLWNYKRMKFKDKITFWKNAREYVKTLPLNNENCKGLGKRQKRLLLDLKKYNFYSMLIINSIKSILSFIFSIKNKEGKKGIYKQITIFGIKLKFFHKPFESQFIDKESNKKPLVSVVMPVYNSEKYIKESIDSILAQTYSNFEFIIVYDKSTDKTLDIIKSYQDERIKIINGDNCGLAAALNKGILSSKGKYIARMDSDDISLPERFEKQVEYLENNPEISLLGSWQEHFGNENNIHKPQAEPDFAKMMLVFGCDFCHSTVMFNRLAFMQNFLLYPTNSIQEDYELWSKAIGVIKVANIPEVLGRYRVSGENITNNKIDELDSYEAKIALNNIKKYFKINLDDEKYYLTQRRNNPYWQMSKDDRIAYQKELKDLYLKIEKQNKKIKFINPNNMHEALKKSWRLTCGDENFVCSKYAPPYRGDFEEFMFMIENVYILKIVEKIFSIATSNNGTHKVLTIFGLKLKWKRWTNKKKIFLFGIATHNNIGDSAITEAELYFAKKYFKDYEIIEVPLYEYDNYIELIKKICTKDDMIWTSGGGNLGNRYLFEEEQRRKLVNDFKDNSIFIFPQSIYFSEDENGAKEIKASNAAYESHKSLLLFARDEKSLDNAKKYFPNVESMLFPDIVCLKRYEKKIKRKDILVCIRDVDDESGLTQEQYDLLFKYIKTLNVKIDYTKNLHSADIPPSIRKKVVEKQLENFAKHKFVITDRLHGLIFSYITNTPVIVIKSLDHKIPEFMKFLNGWDGAIYIGDNIEEFNDAVNKIASLKSKKYPNLNEYFDKMARIIEQKKGKNSDR